MEIELLDGVRRHLEIDVRRFQLLVRGPQLLVGRLQLLVGRLELLVCWSRAPRSSTGAPRCSSPALRSWIATPRRRSRAPRATDETLRATSRVRLMSSNVMLAPTALCSRSSIGRMRTSKSIVRSSDSSYCATPRSMDTPSRIARSARLTRSSGCRANGSSPNGCVSTPCREGKQLLGGVIGTEELQPLVHLDLGHRGRQERILVDVGELVPHSRAHLGRPDVEGSALLHPHPCRPAGGGAW